MMRTIRNYLNVEDTGADIVAHEMFIEHFVTGKAWYLPGDLKTGEQYDPRMRPLSPSVYKSELQVMPLHYEPWSMEW